MPTTDRERHDLLESLRTHRGFLRHTVQGLTDAQARATPTASALCLGGIIKHVAATESQWVDFIERGAAAMVPSDDAIAQWADGFAMNDDDTLDALLARYDEVAARTDALVSSQPDLESEQALPPAPWFPPGASWSARRVVVHIIAETAQHAGHADILRESIDGQRTMG